MKYWEVEDKAVLAELKTWLEIAENGTKEVEKLRKKFKASDAMLSTGFLTPSLTGFRFKDENAVDLKVWKRNKKHDFWEPRLSSKEGKAIRDMLEAVDLGDRHALCDIVGMSWMNGFQLRCPGVDVFGKRYFVTASDDVVPHGCVRISDIDFETAKKRSKAAKKAAKTRKRAKK